MGREPIALVPKPTVETEIRESAIKLLNEAIADVEAGTVSGVIILSKETSGTWYHRASGTISLREEIGSIFLLLWDRIARSRVNDVLDP